MKTREERMYEHLYSNEGRVEQCERICNLEELVKNMILFHHVKLCPVCPFREECFDGTHPYECIASDKIEEQARELGIEVPS